MRSRSFVVTMGQAYYEDLPRALREMGGHVGEVERGPVEVQVFVSFPKGRTVRDVQAALWARWPACSVGVHMRGPLEG